jgi:hypothetical protein
VGLLAWFAYTRSARRVIACLLPGGLRGQVVNSHPRVPVVATAILLGAVTHSVWDSFTHGSGWAVRQLPSLARPVMLATQLSVPWFKVLQHGSTILGGVVLFLWCARWWGQQPTRARRYSHSERSWAIRLGVLVLSVAVAGAVANGVRAIDRGLTVVLGYSAVGGMAALVVALSVGGLFLKAPTHPDPAT